MKNYFSKKSLTNAFKILKNTFTGFMADKGLKLSASLSYYTLFSLAPLLLLIISLAGVIFGQTASEGRIFDEINGLIGAEAATQVQQIIRNLQLSGKSTLSAIIGAITLVIGATTVFGEIQDSINMIWRVKAKPKRGWLKMLKDRLLSGSIIVGLGFLLIVSLIINGALMALNEILRSYFPDLTIILINIANIVISFAVITVLFGVIFKVLPDAKIAWKDVRAGAFFTALLFMLGRYLIGIYIETTAAGSPYGAAGSIIVILLWIYYTAAILYFGAEYTREYACFKGARIQPAEYAVYVEQKETERNVEFIPSKHEGEDKK
ncbi:YihY/virulence factor BrkB family protein [Flavobacterium sp. DG1-102-2]|uniref:YihY/virulence factor BrkB family protein n=1 Tax=Flavobacterium sp. DG1-102-2 TaxID=3081663 RepID=UPI00294925E8|nr:YihY/virulence factor BrkB family protein [Flavobacterium sp. DG1-102-2]MDV6168179.1 YihY/virulence factor BrkB family protein [Flavobacterium sp. DG1-102-2]